MCHPRHAAIVRGFSTFYNSTYAIPTTRSAAWKSDALRGKRLAQYRTWPKPPLRDKLRE